ncbi:hypothetical protein Tco_1564225 [Tanacetum coccineum]
MSNIGKYFTSRFPSLLLIALNRLGSSTLTCRFVKSILSKAWQGYTSLLLKLRSDKSTKGRSSYARVMIELRADVELKDNIVVSTASSSGNKKGVEPTIKVSNSNPFDVLNSVDNDVELGTNGGTTNLFEDLLTSGQANLVDKAGNPLKKVEFRGEYDSKDEVALIDKDMARSMESKRVGFGTQSLPE